MSEPIIDGSVWKQKVGRELAEYWLNFAYLFIFFGVFVMYRRLVMAEYKISYYHYGYAFFKALVLAKVVMIGDFLGLAGRLRDKPLIVTTLYKAVVFAVWVFFFDVVEHTVGGLLHGKGFSGGIDWISSNLDELLAGVLVVFFSFIPFFAFKELGRVLGVGRIAFLFFRKRAALESELSLRRDE